MNESKNNASFKDVFIKRAVVYNPVLTRLVGLCPVVAACVDLENAAALSAATFASLTVTCVVASALFKKIPRWIRIALYLATGLLIICPALLFVETKTLANLSLGIKIYLPLVAASSITVARCERFAVKNDVKLAFYDAAAAGIGAASVFLFIGAIREILGNSSVAGFPLDLPITLKGTAFPFVSFVALGFCAAILRAAAKKFRLDGYADSTETIKTAPSSVPETATPYDGPTETEIFDDASGTRFPSPEEEAEEILKFLKDYLEGRDDKK